MTGTPELRLGEDILADALLDEKLDAIIAVAGRPLTRPAEILVAAGLCRWANHEAVAFQMAIGVANEGGRAVVLVKQVGLNAGLDVLACAAPLRIGGAMVVIAGDDPGAQYSQLEGDSRVLSAYCETPCIDVRGGEDIPEALGEALELSARSRLPVVLRVTTQLMMQRRARAAAPNGRSRLRGTGYGAPSVWWTDSLGHRLILLDELAAIDDRGATERRPGGAAVRVVASGEPGANALCIQGLDVLNIRRVVPFPEEELRKFCREDGDRAVLVLEDGRPFIEDAVRALSPGTTVLGRRSGHVAGVGPVDVEGTIALIESGSPPRVGPFARGVDGDASADLAGYGTLFDDVVALGLAPIAVDAGNSWAAAYLPDDPAPFSYGLGSAIGVAAGLSIARGGPAVAAIGDFAMYHAGVLSLIQVVRDQLPVTTVVLEDGRASYTGGQPHSGSAASGNQRRVVLDELVRGTGITAVERVSQADTSNGRLRSVLRRLAEGRAPAVVVLEHGHGG